MTETPPPAAAAPQPAAPLTEAEDRQWASFAHLGGVLFYFLPSLIIWLVFKARGTFTDVEAKEALNFQITLLIAHLANWIVIGAILGVLTFGITSLLSTLIWLALLVVSIIFSILGFLKAKDGVHYRYPFAIRLVK
jgi:uncharacterized Tic20 family protein